MTNFHPRGGGGHVTYIRSLLALQDGGDFCIAVAAPKTSDIYLRLKDAGYADLYDCDFPAKPQKELPGVIRSLARFRAVVADFKPDIVHANGGPDLAIAVWSHPFGRYRIVRTHHGIKSLGRDIYHRYLYGSRVAQSIFVSSSSMDMSQRNGLAPRHSVVITNCVDLNAFQPDFPKDEALLARLGLAKGTFIFGTCAGVDPYKRVDLAIAAGARQKSPRPFAILAIGNEECGPRLEKMAEASGVTQFRYCGFRSDVRGFVALLDVGFILSDTIETISYAAREMLAMGKPLISSSFAGLRENIVDGENGILTRPGNVDDVAAAMERFLAMPAERLAWFSHNARAYAEQRFSVEHQLRRHAAAYEAALKR
jgi:glycosyltransferase involved in cell wall biosynthesis